MGVGQSVGTGRGVCVGIGVLVGLRVAVGGTAVAVGTSVAVAVGAGVSVGSGVLVGGAGVAVGGATVAVGGTDVAVGGIGALVGGAEVAVLCATAATGEVSPKATKSGSSSAQAASATLIHAAAANAAKVLNFIAAPEMVLLSTLSKRGDLRRRYPALPQAKGDITTSPKSWILIRLCINYDKHTLCGQCVLGCVAMQCADDATGQTHFSAKALGRT